MEPGTPFARHPYAFIPLEPRSSVIEHKGIEKKLRNNFEAGAMPAWHWRNMLHFWRCVTEDSGMESVIA